MLTGSPPFQSKTQEEIYRKVKARSYLWPPAEICPNPISDNAKILVGGMLVEASERPEPDDIVSHAFFKKGLVPGSISPAARFTKPDFEEWSKKTGVSEESWWDQHWRRLCTECGVGWIDEEKTNTFRLPYEERITSTFKECLVEEKLGRTPIVPLPAHMIYEPLKNDETKINLHDQPLQKGNIQIEKQRLPESFLPPPISNISTSEKKLPPSQPATHPVPAEAVIPARQVAPKRQGVRSHAAQLREKDMPTKPAVAGRLKPSANPGAEMNGRRVAIREPRPEPPSGMLGTGLASSTGRDADAHGLRPEPLSFGMLNAGPTRPTGRVVDSQESAKQSRTIRLTRSQTSQGQLLQKSGEAPPDIIKKSTSTESVKQEPTNLGPTRSQEELREPEFSLIDPREIMEDVPLTKATDVQARLTAMLDSLRTAFRRKQSPKSAAPKKSTPMPMVVKWVDYTNKYGIGYVLSNGDVGCLLNAETNAPSSGVHVRDDVLRPGRKGTALQKMEGKMSPLQGQQIEFYENYAKDGFKCVRLEEKQYKAFMETDSNSLSGHDLRKQKAIILLTKFAAYMRDALGKRHDQGAQAPRDTSDETTEKQATPRQERGPCILFYQRLGNVGVWGFADGAFQVSSRRVFTKFLQAEPPLT